MLDQPAKRDALIFVLVCVPFEHTWLLPPDLVWLYPARHFRPTDEPPYGIPPTLPDDVPHASGAAGGPSPTRCPVKPEALGAGLTNRHKVREEEVAPKC